MSLVSGINAIDSLAYASWNFNAHTPVALSYSFLTSVPSDAEPGDELGFAPMSSLQQAGARAAMALWAAVANISFTEVASNGDIQLGTNDQSADKSAGYAYFPSAKYQYSTPLYTNNKDSSSTHLSPGEYGFAVLIHELGHTLGLKHPGSYGASSGTDNGPYLPAATDNRDYTQMSYNDPSSYNTLGLEPITPMLYDIQAIQYLYGANMGYHAGDDVYTFSNRSAPQCIWDGGGLNTFDFSRCSTGSSVDLHAGAFSSTARDYNNVSIAYGVTIQKALGGIGNDSFFCNDAGDTIDGGSGNDLFIGGAGADQFTGGLGNDIVRFALPAAAHVLLAAPGGWQVLGEGGDLLTGIEELDFADVSVQLASVTALAQPLASQQGFVLHAFSYTVPSGSFVAAAGAAAPVYSASLVGGQGLPAWLSFDPASARFSGTPGLSDSSTLDVRVSASDSRHVTVAEDFRLSIAANGVVFSGGSGNDVFSAGYGNESIDGGAGRDLVAYAGARVGYTITAGASAGSFTVSDLAGNGGSDSLINIERLSFSDGALAFDIAGDGGQAYRVYQAAFNRVPDLGGLGFWISVMDYGTTLNEVAAAFIASSEFQVLYGSAPSHAELVGKFYDNVLHRTGEAAGFNFWVGVLDSGQATPATVLASFSESAENQAALIGVIGNGFAYTPFS
ncbi:MAG: DUF4214 domain-containing protein [Pseudomonadota bacterium]